MSRKIKWEISQDGYGPQCVVVAPTRSAALGIAEAKWLRDTADYRAAFIDDDGDFHHALEMPKYTARKVESTSEWLPLL